MDAVVVGLTTLDRFFETGLELVHEIVTAPNLENDDFNRIRNLRLERLKQMKDHAGALAERAFARVLYGSHPYGHLSLGSEAALTSMTLDHVRAMHAAMFAPAGSTLIVVGDRPEEELLDVAAKMFDPWRAALSAAPIDRDAALLPPPAMPAVKLGVVSRPGAAQSELRIGHVCARALDAGLSRAADPQHRARRRLRQPAQHQPARRRRATPTACAPASTCAAASARS